MSAISQYKLTNVLGTMYSEGNLVFTPDGGTLIGPVGNKLILYDLKSQKSRCLCFDSTHNYTLVAISPDGAVLVALNEIGLAHFINLTTNALLRAIRLGKLGCIKFSPNGKWMAVGSEKNVMIYRVPSDESIGSNKPETVRIFKDVGGQVTAIDWSWDSKLIVAGSRESPMLSVFSMEKFRNFKNSCFTGHTEGILGVWFEDWDYNIYSICRGGLMCKWSCSTEPELWEPEGVNNPDVVVKEEDEDAPTAKKAKEDDDRVKELTKFLLDNKAKLLTNRQENSKQSSKEKFTVTCADIADNREFAIIGYEDGVFQLVGLPNGELIQQLRVTEHEVTTIAFAPKGEWFAIGAGKVGQLLVYDWQAEDYVLKEQGHLDTIQCLDFSTDGLWVVTGAHDGKVKLWKTRNCFSFHTFSAHTSIVTGVTFMQNNRAVLSSSLDGTVRAFDVKRDRNFRTFTSPIPTQFCGVTVDSSSTYVASGSVDTFNVYVWHLASGRFLLEVTGHEAPISAISFSPKQGSSMLATVSWDRTLRIRDCIETESSTQVVQLEAEGTALAFRPDGKEITVATLNGGLTFIDPEEQKTLGSINCSHHMAARRLDGDGLRVDKNLEDLSFNAVSYSADGTWLLAGGKSVNLCMYSSSHQVIAHKITLTKNRSLDGLSIGWTQKRANEFGLIDMLEERGKGDDNLKLPGTKATSTNRTYKEIVKVYATKFSPTGLMWAAATTEGVMLFSMDQGSTFNPLGASTVISPQAILESLDEKNFDAALYMALRLNIASTTTMVLEMIPQEYYRSIARVMPIQEVKECLQHLASILDESSHIEFHMLFIKELLQLHTHELIEDLEFMRPVMNAVKRATNARVKDNSEISEQNKYLIDVADILQQQKEFEGDSENGLDSSVYMNGVAVKMEVVTDSDSDSDFID